MGSFFPTRNCRTKAKESQAVKFKVKLMLIACFDVRDMCTTEFLHKVRQ